MPRQPSSPLENRVDLFLLGSGVYSFFDVTLYTQSILKKCEAVFYLHDMPTLDQYLRKVTQNPINLLPLYYTDGRHRTEIYEDVVAHVMKGVKASRPAAVLLHGHPLVCSTISQRLIEECRARSVEVEVVPALSSLDRIFVALELDFGRRGLQLVEATAAVGQNLQIAPKLDLLLYQIGALNNDHASRVRSARMEDVEHLKNYLLKFYPPDHLLYVVECAVEIGFETKITSAKLGQLELACDTMDYTSTLFVPACERHA
jgi:uncharacterized protein YabN with tetrapyrrole methylase and pyrophosphatase domain